MGERKGRGLEGGGRVFLVALLTLAGVACDDVTEPVVAVDVSGFWSGQYVVTGCTLSDAVDPAFCQDIFPSRASLILEMDLSQDGADVFGVMGQGELQGDVEGFVDDNGILFLGGLLGGDTATTTEILAWQTGLVGDSLVGSWRFEAVDNSGSGLGVATVDATMRLLGPSVLKLFGCPVEGQLPIDNQVTGDLHLGDCEFADASFFDLYSFRGSAGDSVEIALRSPSFDAFLLVADTDETELGADDDSGGGAAGTDAAITIVFEVAGTVLLAANSATGGETGPYTMSATQLGPTAAPVTRAPGASRAVLVVSGADEEGRASDKTRPRLLTKLRSR